MMNFTYYNQAMLSKVQSSLPDTACFLCTTLETIEDDIREQCNSELSYPYVAIVKSTDTDIGNIVESEIRQGNKLYDKPATQESIYAYSMTVTLYYEIYCASNLREESDSLINNLLFQLAYDPGVNVIFPELDNYTLKTSLKTEATITEDIRINAAAGEDRRFMYSFRVLLDNAKIYKPFSVGQIDKIPVTYIDQRSGDQIGLITETATETIQDHTIKKILS